MRSTRSAMVAGVCLVACGAARGEGGDFTLDVRPILEKYCFSCHGMSKPKAGVNVAQYETVDAVQRDPDQWLDIIEAMRERLMPPSDAELQPSEEERELVIAGVERVLAAMESRDPGRQMIHRLTRAEYNNTVRDLLGVSSRPADVFPADGGGGEGFDNNSSTLFIPPILMERYLAAAEAVIEEADPTRYLIAEPGQEMTEEQAARVCIEGFARRAFRRPVEPGEVDRYITLWRAASDRGDGFGEAVKLAMRGVMVSPNFLFRVEHDRPGTEPYRISDWELASRLSYFIWGSMPDEQLFQLAQQGRLSDGVELARQVRRMLADPRSAALAESFAGQWMDLRKFEATEPDPRRYPEYTPELKQAMAAEPVAFFDGLIREDGSVLDLIDSDYAYLNELLAGHYGIEGVRGSEFRKVGLSDRRRGGMLGMGAMLTVTSYPRRTSPVLRGKWVLEELLGTPPPPPPPMVRVLRDDDRVLEGLSFRQRLEKHREDATCAACHARLDPLGFGLENFDAIGRWRDQLHEAPVDAAGTLTTGEAFTGPEELKTILMGSKRHLFVRNLTKKMMSFALSRGLEYYDEPAITKVIAAVESNEYRLSVLVTEIARSYPFQHRRNEPLDLSIPIAGVTP